MRLSVFWAFIALVGAAAISWGWSVGGEAVPARPADQTIPASAEWLAGLPFDPEAATAAFVARIPQGMRERGEKYSDTRMQAFVLRVLSLVLATAFVCATRATARMRELVTRVVKRREYGDAAVALQYFLALFVLSLPVEIYATFLRPHRFGFSDQPFGAWFIDSLIDWGVFTAFYTVAVLALYAFIRRRPTQWVAWATGVYLVLRIVYELLAPGVIEPLTNTFRPLADGHQKQLILALARANGIADVAVVTSDASRQSRLLNAHVSGIAGSARISVDDTTLESTSDPVLRAVVGHEIGHYVLNHRIQYVVTDTLITFVGLVLISLGLRLFVGRLGPRLRVAGVGDIAGLPIFWGLFLLWGFASLPLGNAISRDFERQADLYGLNASQAPLGLAEFMIHDADTVRLQPGVIEYALFYTHPGAIERVATAMQWRVASRRDGPP
jgi:STE24 endopeptidase